MWIVIGVVVLGLIFLVAVTLPVLGKVSTLQRAMVKVQRRQAEAMALQEPVEQLQRTVLEVQERTTTMQERIDLIKAGRGESTGKHALRPRG
jgi:biopolymer transport protein ExbB/TolQ